MKAITEISLALARQVARSDALQGELARQIRRANEAEAQAAAEKAGAQALMQERDDAMAEAKLWSSEFHSLNNRNDRENTDGS